MTKGQLLALDNPANIKKQFGVGYKLLVEPRSDQLDSEQFMEIKKNEIDPIMAE